MSRGEKKPRYLVTHGRIRIFVRRSCVQHDELQFVRLRYERDSEPVGSNLPGEQPVDPLQLRIDVPRGLQQVEHERRHHERKPRHEVDEEHDVLSG